MSGEEEIHPALLRSRVYGLLRRVVSDEVDAPFLEWCREQEQRGLWSSLNLPLGEGLSAGNSEAVVEELAADFCHLFVTSGVAGSPHESVHAGSSGEGRPLLWGDAASAVKQLYREAGFELDEEAHRLPDALTVELEFMERLAAEEARVSGERETERLRELQTRMLRDHLARWVPPYARSLSGRAGSGFYDSMLNLMAAFVEWDAAREG